MAFSEAPTPSFGDTNGQSVDSEFADGGVEVIPDGPFAADDAWTVDEGATLDVYAVEGVYEENVVLDADILLEVGVSEDLRSVPGENPAIIGNGGEGPSMVIEDGSAIFYNGVLQ